MTPWLTAIIFGGPDMSMSFDQYLEPSIINATEPEYEVNANSIRK